ncbi:MAG: hypothetical protein LBT05_06455 [Planctomycetaceae bacterium]|nr:hypothetical protein [Planctomycetaceae bacterium]
MNKEVIIAVILTKVKSDLQHYVGDFDHPLSLANAEIMTKNLVAIAQFFCEEVMKIYLTQHETQENTVVHNGKKYFFKCPSEKGFLAIFGKTSFERRLYCSKDGEYFVPLDTLGEWKTNRQRWKCVKLSLTYRR